MEEQLSTPLDEFKERELEIINLMAEGLSNKQIADRLFITKETVRWYNKQIYSKLGTSRRTEAIALARRMGLLNGDAADSAPSHRLEHRLPVTTGPFIGRDDEIAELADLLARPEIRLLSILGPGGMGKSRLSLELGHVLQAGYADGAAFVDLTAVDDPENVARSAATRLGLTIVDRQDPLTVILDYCREKALLLIFDNFEHLLSGATLLPKILEAAPQVKIITTSREKLNLFAETCFSLLPVSQSGARLFVEIAAMMRPNIVIDENEWGAVHRIVELVGGLPLALILAAIWVDTLTVTEIADEIELNLDFLSAEMGDMPERQRSMHAVIDPTWNRLNDSEQRAFMWASVFRGGFTRAHFQQVTGASLRTVQTLLGRSLINHGRGQRFDLHPLLRQYAHEKLEASGLSDEAKRAHLQTYLRFAQEQSERMYSGRYLESLEVLEREDDNFDGGLNWALAGHAVQDGVSLVLSLCRFWRIRSQTIRSNYYLEQALSQVRQGSLHYWQASCQERLGNIESALHHLNQSVSLAQEEGDHDTLAMGYSLLGHLLMNSDPDRTRRYYQRAYVESQVLRTPHLIASCHIYRSLLSSDVDHDETEALHHLQHALDISEEIGDLHGISIITYNMARIYDVQGDRQRAKKHCESSLRLKRQIGDRAGAARRLTLIANWEIVEENTQQAIQYLAEAQALCEETGERSRLAAVLMSKGMLHLVMNEFDEAHMELERGLRIALATENYYAIPPIHSYLALLHLIQSNLELAKPHVANAIRANAKSTFQPWVSIIAYATYLWRAGRVDAAVPIAAVLFINQERAGEEDFDTKFFLEPLIYRIEQEIGEEAWQQAIGEAAGVSVDLVFDEIVEELSSATTRMV